MTTIRPATSQDLQAIAEIHVGSWRTAFRGIMPDALLDAMDVADRREMWRNFLGRHPDGLLVAADNRETVLGFCCTGPVTGHSNDAPYDGRIYALHVHPNLKRQGIGTQLVSGAFDRLRGEGCRSVILWTLEDMTPSRRFYENLGGTEVRSKITDFGGAKLVEVAYAWDDLAD